MSGLSHVEIYADSQDQILALQVELRARGVPILNEDREPGESGAPSPYAVYFEDPDRIKVEVVVRDGEGHAEHHG